MQILVLSLSVCTIFRCYKLADSWFPRPLNINTAARLPECGPSMLCTALACRARLLRRQRFTFFQRPGNEGPETLNDLLQFKELVPGSTEI